MKLGCRGVRRSRAADHRRRDPVGRSRLEVRLQLEWRYFDDGLAFAGPPTPTPPEGDAGADGRFGTTGFTRGGSAAGLPAGERPSGLSVGVVFLAGGGRGGAGVSTILPSRTRSAPSNSIPHPGSHPGSWARALPPARDRDPPDSIPRESTASWAVLAHLPESATVVSRPSSMPLLPARHPEPHRRGSSSRSPATRPAQARLPL